MHSESWIDPWLDEEKLLPGQEWELEIEKAVESADVVIACLSTKSVSKEGYVQKELRFGLSKADEKPLGILYLLPMHFDDCVVPCPLQIWHYVDYFPAEKRDETYRKILLALETKAKSSGILFSGGMRESSLYSELVLLTGGDREVANCLLNYEQQNFPSGTRKEIIERARDRPLGDRRE